MRCYSNRKINMHKSGHGVYLPVGYVSTFVFVNLLDELPIT